MDTSMRLAEVDRATVSRHEHVTLLNIYDKHGGWFCLSMTAEQHATAMVLAGVINEALRPPEPGRKMIIGTAHDDQTIIERDQEQPSAIVAVEHNGNVVARFTSGATTLADKIRHA